VNIDRMAQLVLREPAKKQMAPVHDAAAELRRELDIAEQKAWDALGRYKFQMFGYWAAIWVHLNRIGNFKRPNPWKKLVLEARR
jgi:hypothetical protein